MADKNNNNNANPNEEQQEDIEIDEELLNFFRNGTDNRDGLNRERRTQDEISSLMEEIPFDDYDEFPPDDFDGEMWNIEYLSFIKVE
ncbi:hypothetical protein Anas_01553 [Armadillidium nasatum]|uniref:Uncharacterized protein n=1 Tax=Armadillidium nasatum TaxID=96803 RepID=A0A5N5TLP2_9CRUS|nr:hypothetical protein Anas_01553 [Armadillidium nasatum]